MKIEFLKSLTIGAAICGISLFTSCAKKSGSPGGPGGTGSGTFSVAIAGKTISGTSADNSAVVIIKADPTAAFDTMGDIFVDMHAAGDSIGWHLPDRTGLTVIGPGSAATIYGVLDTPDTFYLFNGVSVNVTLLTATRIQGTFSGDAEESLIPGQGTHIQMTNGTFDLPIIQ